MANTTDFVDTPERLLVSAPTENPVSTIPLMGTVTAGGDLAQDAAAADEIMRAAINHTAVDILFLYRDTLSSLERGRVHDFVQDAVSRDLNPERAAQWKAIERFASWANEVREGQSRDCISFCFYIGVGVRGSVRRFA